MKTAIIGIAALTTLTIQAENISLDIEPGLWRHSMAIQSASGEMERAMQEMQRQLAALPESQRQMMQQMMAAQGMSFDGLGGTVDVCLTAEDIRQGVLPQQDGCQQQVKSRGKNSYSFTFQCDSKPPTSGQGELTFSSRKAYQGKASFSTEINGKAEQMTMQQSGEWLAASCQ